jgi:hypothetical protein
MGRGDAIVNIRDTIGALVTLLEAVTVTAPRATSIKKVYRFAPDQGTALTMLPCAMLSYEQQPVRFLPALMMKPYVIRIMVFVGQTASQAEAHADTASALLDEIITTLSENQRLDNTVGVIREFRGASPDTIVLLDRNGIGYVGLDLYLEVTLNSAANHAA